MTKDIAILTAFASLDPQYSLANLVVDQIRMLLKHGYNPTLFTVQGFKDKVPCEVKAVIPQVPLVDYQLNVKKQDSFDGQVKLITEALEPYLKNFQIVFTHDLAFLTWFLVYNQAIRNIAKKHPHIKWFHWSHSAPSNRPAKLEYPHTLRFSGIHNSIYIGMNYADLELYAEQYDVPIGNVRVVYNCRDIYRWFNMHPKSIKLIEKYRLLDTDVLAIYPTRMTTGKNPDDAVHLLAKINETGKNAKLVFCNSYSNADTEKQLIQSLKDNGEKWGLPNNHLIFTSEMGTQWELGVPPEVVRDLMQISNLFFLPSKSEGCSLILLEATLTKNLIILNKTLPSMHEFGKKDALYIDCSSVRAGKQTTVNYLKDDKPSTREEHYKEWAQIIINELENNKSLSMFTRIRKKFNPDWIFRNQLEPLLK